MLRRRLCSTIDCGFFSSRVIVSGTLAQRWGQRRDVHGIAYLRRKQQATGPSSSTPTPTRSSPSPSSSSFSSVPRLRRAPPKPPSALSSAVPPPSSAAPFYDVTDELFGSDDVKDDAVGGDDDELSIYAQQGSFGDLMKRKQMKEGEEGKGADQASEPLPLSSSSSSSSLCSAFREQPMVGGAPSAATATKKVMLDDEAPKGEKLPWDMDDEDGDGGADDDVFSRMTDDEIERLLKGGAVTTPHTMSVVAGEAEAASFSSPLPPSQISHSTAGAEHNNTNNATDNGSALLKRFFDNPATPVVSSLPEGSTLHNVFSFVDAHSELMQTISDKQRTLKERGQFNALKFPAAAKEGVPTEEEAMARLSSLLNIPQRPYRLAFNTALSSVDLMDHANAIGMDVIPKLPVPGYVLDVAKGFTDRKLRHEPVLKAAFWKTFKWDYFAEHRAGGSGAAEVADALASSSSSSSGAIVPASSGFNATALANLPAPLLFDLTSTSAAMFELMTEQRFFNDKQLLFIAMGRLIECAPFMLPRDVASVLTGLKHYNKLHFSVSDVLLEASNHDGSGTVNLDTLGNAALIEEMGPQGNIIDFLLDRMERQMVKTRALLTTDDVIRIMEGLSHTGVRDPNIIRTLAKATARLTFTPYQAGKLLQYTAAVHERLVASLVKAAGGPRAFGIDDDGDDDDISVARAAAKAFVDRHTTTTRATKGAKGADNSMKSNTNQRHRETTTTAVVSTGDSDDDGSYYYGAEKDEGAAQQEERALSMLDVDETLKLCAPLFIEAAKKINHTSLSALSKDNPMLIIELRKMCETNALITQHVPQLWDAIRDVYIPQKALYDSRRKREFGANRLPAALEVGGKAFKVKSVVSPRKHPREKVPNAFREWEQKRPWYDDPSLSKNEKRAKGGFSVQPRRQYMGVHKIKKETLLRNEVKRTRGLRPVPKKAYMRGTVHDGEGLSMKNRKL